MMCNGLKDRAPSFCFREKYSLTMKIINMIHFNKMIVANTKFELNSLTGVLNSAGPDGIRPKVFFTKTNKQQKNHQATHK